MVLINVPRLDLPGGVANYYRVLRPYLDGEYFEIGAKPGSNPLIRMLVDYWRFYQRLRGVELVHLNPSLGLKSALRDAVFLLIARARGVPVLVFFRGWDQGFRASIERRCCWLFRWILNKAASIIVLSEEFRSQLERMGVTAPIGLSTTCVDDTIFERETTRSYDRLNILYLSRLDHGKGVLDAIKAVSLLDATLTIAGDGPEREAAQKLAGNNVRFLGHIEGEDKARAYREANVYLFTSLSEGMPTTVLEAMAYGLPVVTSRVGGLKDFFNDRMGFMTEDPAEFAALLNRLTPELCRKMGDYNRAYAKRHFAASRVAANLQQAYTQAIAVPLEATT